MKKLLFFAAILVGVTISLIAADDNAAIIAATKSYVAANSAISKMNVTVEQVVDNFARARVIPQDRNAADPAWVFLKKKDGKWTGLILGTGLTTEDYQQLGIPNALRIP